MFKKIKKKILLINPNKWGRGITTIWVASHAGVLKKDGNDVKLFDATFYSNWSDREVDLNTNNLQFQKTSYYNKIKWNNQDIKISLQNFINKFSPDIIFSGALSSHIHGEGEYVNIQYAYDLLKGLKYKSLLIFGGIQSTSAPELIIKKMPKIDYLISGESELVLREIAKAFPNKKEIERINGVNFYKRKIFIQNPRQKIIRDLDLISPYDYSLFDKQVFFRPYNGKVLKAVDYELSRGCIYACSYCVETIIQKYYGFNNINKKGTLLQNKLYLRNKSAEVIFKEMKKLNKNYKITLFRCQDTNFLTISREVLMKLSELISKSKLNIKLYIETRAEGINQKSIQLLKKLKVDGVGMGLELSDEGFREKKLNRFVDTNKLIKAFKLLKKNKINTTAYNIIGLPDQTEASIIDTLKINIKLNPSVSSVAYYSAYNGTNLAYKAKKNFSKYPEKMDAQLRSEATGGKISTKILDFYKSNFNYLIKKKLKNLDKIKAKWISAN